MTEPAPAPPATTIWGTIARLLAVAAPPLAWLIAFVNIRDQTFQGSSLGVGLPSQWTLLAVGAVAAVTMAYLANRMIRRDPAPRELLGFLGLAALPWILGALGTVTSSGRTLSDASFTGLAGYVVMIMGQAQGALLSWSLLGSAAFTLTVATFIRRVRPASSGNGMVGALSAVPALVFAVVAVGSADLGPIGAGLIAAPVSALLNLWFVGAATRPTPRESTVMTGIWTAFAFGLAFTAALSAAYSAGVERMIMAVYSSAGVGVDAIRAGLAEVGSVGALPAFGLPFAFAPVAAVAYLLRRGGLKVQSGIVAVLPVLLIGWGLQMLSVSKTQGALTLLSEPGIAGPPPPEPADILPDSASLQRPPEVIALPSGPESTGAIRIPDKEDFSGRGIEGGVPGGVVGGVVEPVKPSGPTVAAELVSRVQPEYPTILKRALIGGRAVVSVEIDENGNVTAATVVNATHAAFGDASLAAIRRWQYRPALRNGTAVASRKQETVTFTP